MRTEFGIASREQSSLPRRSSDGTLLRTNGMENFRSLVKRQLTGTYISVEPFHLFRYLDEQTFRYHHRATKDRPYTNADRFAVALTQIAGKRLTWNDLTGKEEGSF